MCENFRMNKKSGQRFRSTFVLTLQRGDVKTIRNQRANLCDKAIAYDIFDGPP
jgi:hypothetical protein